jgi:oxygen-independent coproporphyrinogen-3 oxidase
MAGLYIHIPFCLRKCPYCDFYSTEAGAEPLQAYPQLLTRHLEWAAEHGWQHPVDTIYFGGGTPSLLPAEAVRIIIEEIDRHYSVADDVEISLEANPGTVCLERLRGYRSAGVNRLSLGLQTGSDRLLRVLGRLHDRSQGLEAYAAARQAGFENISLDLMFALPGQSREDLEGDLQTYLDLGPEHLSCYGLTAEPATALHARVASGALSLPDEDQYADSFMLLHNRLNAAGFRHYEIANYARDGFDCRHNAGYWMRRPYLGVGAGAHSFLDDSWGSRWQVAGDLPGYRQALQTGQDPMTCLETFGYESALSETIYLALRTRRGITDSDLQQRFGCTLQERFPQAIETCGEWLQKDAGRWSLTPQGWLLFDRLIQAFL